MGFENEDMGAPAPQEKNKTEQEIEQVQSYIDLRERVLAEQGQQLYELENNYRVDGFDVIEYVTDETTGLAKPKNPHSVLRREARALEIKQKMEKTRNEIEELKERKSKLQELE